MSFDGLIGQKAVIEHLRNIINEGRVGHAYIFSGPGGTGKRTAAAEFAVLLLCENAVGGNACGVCRSCMLNKNSANPDFLKISAEGASSIGVDEIRKLVAHTMIKPLYSQRKVYIIEDAEKMTVQAQNCLLKTFEEPPSYAVIILTVSNNNLLLETICSRAARLNFKKYTQNEIKEAIALRYGSTETGAGFAAAWAEGSIGKALKMAGSEEFKAIRSGVFEIVDTLINKGLYGVFDAEAFFEKYKENRETVFDLMVSYLRDIMIAGQFANENLLINKDRKDIIFNNAEKIRPVRSANIIESIEAARRDIAQNANYLLSVENMLVGLVED